MNKKFKKNRKKKAKRRNKLDSWGVFSKKEMVYYKTKYKNMTKDETGQIWLIKDGQWDWHHKDDVGA